MTTKSRHHIYGSSVWAFPQRAVAPRQGGGRLGHRADGNVLFCTLTSSKRHCSPKHRCSIDSLVPSLRAGSNNAFAKSDCPSVARRKDEGDDVHGLGLFAGAMLAMGFIGFALHRT